MRILKPKSWVKYVVSIGILAFLFSRMDMNVLIEKSSDLNIFVIFTALILMVLQILFLNLRWHVLLNAGRRQIPFVTSSLINIAGCFANILFITAVGGIVAKSGLAVRHGLSITQALLATFLDRFMTLAALLFFSALSMPFLQNILDSKLSFMLVLSVSGVLVICIGFFVILRTGLLKRYIMASRRRSRFLAYLRSYAGNYKLMGMVGLYSIIAQGFFFLGVFVLSWGIDHPGGHTVGFLALMPVLALIASLPISFGGWGVREGAFIYGLGLIGYSWESAFLLSVQVGIVTMIAPFIVGLPYFLKYDMRAFLGGAYSKKADG